MNDEVLLRDYLLGLFQDRQWELSENTDYYEGKHRPQAVGITTPPQMQQLLASVGYPRLYVNALAERLELEGFRLGGDEADATLWDWWQANDLDVEATLGHTDALVHGRSYVTVSAPSADEPGVDPDVPIIRVEPPTALHAVIDPRTRQVTQAVRVINDDNGTPVSITVYLPNTTRYWTREDNQAWSRSWVTAHGLGMVPVVPLPNRTRLSDLYGTSEITPELRSVTDAASRVMMDMQATAEIMAVPQRLLFGVSADDLGIVTGSGSDGKGHFDAYLARILAFEDPDAKAMQFNAAELRNFTEVLRELAKQAAAYTGLPPQYLSSASDNPASAEAIRASEARLVKNVERKAMVFGGAWEQVMRVAWKVMHPDEAIPAEFFRMEAAWRDPATPTFASKADAVTKLYANGTGIIPLRQARLDMGYSLAQVDQMENWDKQADPFAGMASDLVYGNSAAVQQ